MDSPSVLVVGAGPTGLTLAHELARRGVPFRLIDKLAAPSPFSRALGVHARTREVFDLMGGGIAEEIAEKGVRVRGARLHFPGGREAGMDLDSLPSRHTGVICLPQPGTEAVLAAALRRHGGGVERGVALESLIEAGGGVTATLRRADGTAETARFAYAVGCDGAHSATRKALGFDFAGAAYPEQFLLADLAVAGSLDPAFIHVFPSPGGLLAFFPLPGGAWRVVASLPDAGKREGEPSLEEIQSLVEARCPLGLRLSDSRWRAWFRIHHRIAPRLRSPGGRAFLCGDAAHIHSPAGGQGMNAGIQDAFNLGWKLARAMQGGPSSLLDSYEPERLPVDRGVVRQTDAMTRIISLRPAPLRFLRDRLLPLVTRIPFVRRRAGMTLSQLGIHYRESPLSEDHGGVGPRAGERWDGHPCQVLRYGKGGALGVLLAPSPRDRSAAMEIENRLKARGVEIIRLLPESETEKAAFSLIRPDGYVGFRAPLAEAARLLPAYFERI